MVSLIKLSKEFVNVSSVVVDSSFIVNYLPLAPENAVKVYLYGMVAVKNSLGNTIDNMAMELGLEINEIIGLYEYWQDVGLVRVIGSEPFQVEYLPVSTGNHSLKKYKPEKYEAFTHDLQELFKEQILTPNKFLSFIEVIEDYKIQPDAMLMIADYCIRFKGDKIHINYILTVAKEWAQDGVSSVKDVDKKLIEIELYNDKLREVFVALKIKKPPEIADKQNYIKWNTSWGYDHESIVYTASLIKKGGTAKLDAMLDSFYRKGIFTLSAIKEHRAYIDNAKDTAYEILRNLGLYYDNIEPVIDVYVSVWLDKGMDKEAIIVLSKYCFRRGIRTLDAMGAAVDKFYKMGLVTVESINEYIDKAIALDKKIKSLIERTGSGRRVTDSDRKFYDTWTNVWAFGDDMLEMAADMAADKSHPFSFMNGALARWKQEGVTTRIAAEAMAAKTTAGAKRADKSAENKRFKNERDYSKEDLDGIFADNGDVNEFLDSIIDIS